MATAQQTVLFTSLVSVFISIFGVYWFIKNKLKKSLPQEWKELAEVKNLFLYPLKSGRRLDMKRVSVTERGFQEIEKLDNLLRLRDRCLVVYKEKTYEFRTARTHPRLSLIEVRSSDADGFTLEAPSMESCDVKIPLKEYIQIKQFKDEIVECADCGDRAAEWISRYVLNENSGLRLGYNDAHAIRDITKKYKSKIQYYKYLSNKATGLHHDLCAVHLINQASVDEVNKKLQADWVTPNNFRPNIVIQGTELKPFEEDKWEWVRVGDVILRNVMECGRCTMTTIDWEAGVRRKDEQPLKSMKSYRISEGSSGAPVMGTYYEVVKTGTVSVGDKVYVA